MTNGIGAADGMLVHNPPILLHWRGNGDATCNLVSSLEAAPSLPRIDGAFGVLPDERIKRRRGIGSHARSSAEKGIADGGLAW